MRRLPLSTASLRLERWAQRRGVRQAGLWAMVALGPILVILTFVALSEMRWLGGRHTLSMILLAGFVYAIVVAAVVARGVVAILAARRRGSAGSTMHMRLTRAFSGIALIPTVLVAVFAAITLNFGLEGWFSDRVRNVVTNSLAAAQAYEEEHQATLQADARLLAAFLNDQKARNPLLSGGQLREFLTLGQLQMQRALPKAYVINGDAGLVARGERSYLFDFIPPHAEEIERARAGETVIIQDWPNNEFRALHHLDAFADRFLYVSREVDGEILALLDETTETVQLYHQLESERGRLVFEFALIYLGFALVVILGTIWLGLRFAEGLARPVGRLAAAAERVGQGDFDVRVREAEGQDEIALLGRAFNDMTRQVKAQRDELIAAHEETERRRRLFDSVLTGVTAGVVGLDGEGRVELVNAAAAILLDLDRNAASGRPLESLAPEFAPLLRELETRRAGIAQSQIRLRRRGRDLDLLVRVGARVRADGALEGTVITFDDVTDLVVAQRMAAWGDVARRIAHEVKNPLTPIQLSAERMRRKFGPLVGDQREALEQYADVIVRQTNDLRRIVDEFSKFARMPAPERRPVDLGKLLAETVLLHETAKPAIRYRLDLPETAVLANLDATMIGQAVGNLLKNAAEAIGERLRDPAASAEPGEIRVRLAHDPDDVVIDVIDNGRGLPDEPVRLYEPYVTHRAGGTGLGLSIVKKIVEEHDGSLDLRPAPQGDDGGPAGAWARISLPQTLPVRRAGDDLAPQRRDDIPAPQRRDEPRGAATAGDGTTRTAAGHGGGAEAAGTGKPTGELRESV
jgi:two-component system, NtrC family, nitrogen regulation sensor histidine kinase NtrY